MGWEPKAAYFSVNLLYYGSYVYIPNYLEEVWDIQTYDYGYISCLSLLSILGAVASCRMAESSKAYGRILATCAIIYVALFGGLWIGQAAAIQWSRPVRLIAVALLYGLSSAFGAGLAPLLDHLVLEYLGQDERVRFGRERLWATFGHATIVTVNGWAIDRFGYVAMFASMIFSLALFLATIPFLNITGAAEVQEVGFQNDKVDPSDNAAENACTVGQPKELPRSLTEERVTWETVLPLLTSPKTILFLLIVLDAGYVRCMVGNFASVFFKRVLLLRESAYGAAMQTRIIPELVFFFFGDRLLRIFGPSGLLMVGVMAGTGRSMVYIWATPATSWVVFPGEMMKGLQHAGVIMGGTWMTREMASQGYAATYLAIFHAIYSSVSMILAGILGGIIFERIPDRSDAFRFMFTSTALAGALAIIPFLLMKVGKRS